MINSYIVNPLMSTVAFAVIMYFPQVYVSKYFNFTLIVSRDTSEGLL